jgi:glutathione S-transferase
MEPVLYQFPLSHYCEKVRWVLDHKGIAYRIHNQLPGPHAFINRRRTGSPTVPVLVDGRKAIGGSHAIALHLEAGGGRPLLPKSRAALVRLDEIVGYFDHVAGPAVRRYVYGLITQRPAMFRDVFFRDYAGAGRALGRVLALPARVAIARMYDVHAPSAAELPDLIRSAADGIEQKLEHGQRYLLDDQFSLADITVAALFGPMIGPPGSPWAFELDVDEFRRLRAELIARPVGAYVGRLYAAHRASSSLEA